VCHAFAFERYQQSFKNSKQLYHECCFFGMFSNISYFTSRQLRLDVAVEFCSLMSRLAIMTITFKHLLNSSAYTLPVWAVCEDFPVVARVSSSCYVASMSEANTHTWRSRTNAARGHGVRARTPPMVHSPAALTHTAFAHERCLWSHHPPMVHSPAVFTHGVRARTPLMVLPFARGRGIRLDRA